MENNGVATAGKSNNNREKQNKRSIGGNKVVERGVARGNDMKEEEERGMQPIQGEGISRADVPYWGERGKYHTRPHTTPTEYHSTIRIMGTGEKKGK
jgi:hypothetical protein